MLNLTVVKKSTLADIQYQKEIDDHNLLEKDNKIMKLESDNKKLKSELKRVKEELQEVSDKIVVLEKKMTSSATKTKIVELQRRKKWLNGYPGEEYSEGNGEQ